MHLCEVAQYYPVQPLFIKPCYFVVFLNEVVMRTNGVIRVRLILHQFLIKERKVMQMLKVIY